MAKQRPIQLDVPCDVQQIDGTGFVWTFLDKARNASAITPGAIFISADEVDPALSRVVDVVPEDGDTIVHLDPRRRKNRV